MIETMTSSFMTLLRPNDDVLHTSEFDRELATEFMTKKGITKAVSFVIFRGLWFYQWLPTVGMAYIALDGQTRHI
jgi:hypothetical protein